ncbi:outer membrane-specific lipoprotein transporter subunit; ATP-binding component of ABC superfamily [Pseudoalteromonas sp. 3J6]|jgi:lipoprotein-releasing system ATP-binding protein|uniref:Lipoprotein-releasing system ATP-binding protein LolD n=1 Tax=Pseudoalteromonas undina TaxID=43660 RepID=A0ABP2Y1K2_9GAMM|nr:MULTISPECIES: lipoprotein-releasing ABC transporter ATP-binding protein LolD [Pseudoalteromonas]OLF80278.1 ABC transporter [Pseudoalteromonas haloplanktis]KAF7766526.1 lipoprotein-releasing system ATP-binding protein [Pseudoalteromonas undina]KPH92252.1 ABC transporter [Pseudoalteromonas undina]KPZ66225.1 Lipoprotein-releasing system ATP-binding protein LolD [Pseudoalteromonas sp. P1-16-1b]MCK8125639.1 lipoprotein-releasing ABC transporter ATP-binding protein LolD [Pseudoalteromonas sp. 2CM|tara:strand:+ start:446 stop:1144 length:699 start_codon:yes stop_codon:yes gene_type:complete
MNDLVISCEQISKVYQDGQNQVEVLKGVDLALTQGEMLAIVGSSGSGKSTLLHILGTLDTASSGSAKIKNQDVAKLSRSQQAAFRNQNLGFIYQFHHLLMEFSAVENVAMPLLIKGLSAKEANVKALDMLDKVGLAHRSSHKPSALSGGERQRVAIARALVTEPALVLADEPTGNLDKQNAIKIYDLINQLNKSLNTSFVVVTHDLELADKLGKIAYLDDGKLSIKESNHVA